MSHADATVLAIRDELRASGFKVSKCLVIQDDPQGDFGIAWYTGIVNGCAQMRYDVGYLPTKHTVVHEFGHDMHSKWQSSDILPLFWETVGFPVAMGQAITGDSQYQRWRRTPGEILADLFAWTVLGDWVQTEMFGVPLTDALRFKLQAFFRGFKEEEDMALTDDDKAWLVDRIAESENRVKARLATAEVDILREVTNKLESGFNTTVSEYIDRHTAGDKKVATAPIDQ